MNRFLLDLYRSLGQGNVFTSVCQSFCSRGKGLCQGVSVQRVSIQGVLCPGGLCPGALYPGESLSRGISVQAIYVQGGSLSRGVSVQESLCLAGSLSGGRGLCSRGLCPQGSLSGGSLSRGFSVRETLSGRVSVWDALYWNALLLSLLHVHSNVDFLRTHMDATSLSLSVNGPLM